MNRTGSFLAIIILILLTIAGCGYLQVNPPPDVNLEEDPESPAGWQAAAANMLASAGYGEGATVQERAGNIHSQINAHFGNRLTGWTDAALQWWLLSEHNTWRQNPYQLTTSIGNKETMAPWQDPEGTIRLGRLAREGHFLAIDISWPPEEYQQNPSGRRVLNYVGDNRKKKKIAEAPGHIRVTDPFRNKGGNIQTYELDGYDNPNPDGKNSGKGWYLDYDLNHPFIRSATVLSPVSSPLPEGLCLKATTAYKVKQPYFEDANKFHFTATSDSTFAGYQVLIDRLTRRDPRIIEEVSNDRSITFDWNISHRKSSDGEWLTVSTVMYHARLHQMSYRDIWFTYRGDDTVVAAPNICWNLEFVKLKDVKVPNISGGYVVGSVVIAGSDTLTRGHSSELRFTTQYGIFESPLYHTLNICCDSSYKATGIRLGHSYTDPGPLGLWEFDDWITVHHGEMDLSDSLTFRQDWSREISYPEAEGE